MEAKTTIGRNIITKKRKSFYKIKYDCDQWGISGKPKSGHYDEFKYDIYTLNITFLWMKSKASMFLTW